MGQHTPRRARGSAALGGTPFTRAPRPTPTHACLPGADARRPSHPLACCMCRGRACSNTANCPRPGRPPRGRPTWAGFPFPSVGAQPRHRCTLCPAHLPLAHNTRWAGLPLLMHRRWARHSPPHLPLHLPTTPYALQASEYCYGRGGRRSPVRVRVHEGTLGEGLGAQVWMVAHALCQELASNPQVRGGGGGRRALELGLLLIVGNGCDGGVWGGGGDGSQDVFFGRHVGRGGDGGLCTTQVQGAALMGAIPYRFWVG